MENFDKSREGKRVKVTRVSSMICNKEAVISYDIQAGNFAGKTVVKATGYPPQLLSASDFELIES